MFRDKLKKILPKNEQGEEGNDKKKIENLVFLLILLIITIIIINVIWNDKGTTDNANNSEEVTRSKQLTSKDISSDEIVTNNTTGTENLEQKLENILSKIQGVGEVTVCINYSESSEIIAMYNENSKKSNTEETDTSGGIRKIEEIDVQKDIIYKEEDGEKTPITQKIVQPKIEGAIIAAKGAGNASIKINIIQAVEAITGLPTHKIQVFEMI